jgi:hypothetical protein
MAIEQLFSSIMPALPDSKLDMRTFEEQGKFILINY